jgi:hypothetical protein
LKKKQFSGNILSPEIISIEDFIQDAGIRTVDPIELLLNFMMYTCQLLKKQNQQSFELFANCQNTLAGF